MARRHASCAHGKPGLPPNTPCTDAKFAPWKKHGFPMLGIEPHAQEFWRQGLKPVGDGAAPRSRAIVRVRLCSASRSPDGHEYDNALKS